MPAKIPLPSFHPKFAQTKKPLYLLTLVAIVGAAVWANSALAAATTPTTTNTAMTSALKLAAGTLNLEGTGQAVDAASAATLLPLWQLLEQLDTSGSAAPEEITAVVDEIKLNMTSAQIKAIEAMSISQAELGGASRSAGSSVAGSTGTNAASDPMLGGDIAGGAAPMDGGGPMPSGSSPTTSSTKSTSSASASSAPALIKQVIELLQSKVQS